MHTVRIVCPKCNKERQERSNLKDIYNYTEEIKYERCAKCKKLEKTPEEKMLDAIFGVQNG